MKRKPSQIIAITAFLLNILILPGLGTIIGGRIATGVLQLIFFAFGTILMIGGALFAVLLIGIPFLIAGLVLMFAMWIWSLVSGIKLIRESEL